MVNVRGTVSRLLTGGFTALFAVGVIVSPIRSAEAADPRCPYCYLDMAKDTAEQDNQVVLVSEGRQVHYRCVFCAIAKAKTDFKGDLVIRAASETKGHPVQLARKAGRWSVSPASAVFVAQREKHKHCQITYRAFTNRAGFDAWVKKNGSLLRGAKPIALAQMVEVSK